MNFESVIAAGHGAGWLYLPAAVALGALHGLEPGHSKSLMASFIIAVRGTVGQALLLGLSAAFSHSLIVWLLAFLGLTFGSKMIVEEAEPYLMIITGVIVMVMAGVMLRRIFAPAHHHHHHHGEGCDHDHDHSHPIPQNKSVTTRDVVLFGLTGGLMPCPAAVTVLLICLNLKQAVLGAGLVLGFSAGLAITLVSVGVVAAMGSRALAGQAPRFGAWVKRLPALSGGLMLVLGGVFLVSGISRLMVAL